MRFFGPSEYDEADGSLELDFSDAEQQMRDLNDRLAELDDELVDAQDNNDEEEQQLIKLEQQDLNQRIEKVKAFLGITEW